MTRSLDNLFDEPHPSSKPEPSAPAGGDFDALMDDGAIDTKGAIDPSWDKVRTGELTKPGRETTGAPVTPGLNSTLEEDGLDDLMGMASTRAPAKSTLKRKDFPPEPSLSGSLSGQGDGRANFPWWVIVAAIVLILAGAAAVVTFS